MSDNDRNAIELYRGLGAGWLQERSDPAHTQFIVDLVLSRTVPGDKILDVCCGYGRITFPLLSAGREVCGIDISETLIDKAQVLADSTHVDRKRFVVGNMKSLPYDDGAFDFVLCVWASFNFLIERAEQLTALSEIRRVLRPGGGALIECPYHAENTGAQRHTTEGLDYAYMPLTAENLVELANAASLQVEAAEQLSLGARLRTVMFAVKSVPN